MDHDHHHGTAADNGCIYFHALTFHTNVCQEILFPGWKTSDGLSIFWSAAILFVAGFLYEGLKYYREVMHKKGAAVSSSQVNITKTECGNRESSNSSQVTVQYKMFSGGHILQTLLHIIQTSCSYVLMLVFMTYQVYLCMGLVFGMGLGYFVFGWRKSNVVDSTEHCS